MNTFEIIPHILALAAAYALALPIGWNREKAERSASLRTFSLVALASCGFVQATESLAANSLKQWRSQPQQAYYDVALTITVFLHLLPC
jgi:uncharacterized membrane protein YhiD involved in acid resistance